MKLFLNFVFQVLECFRRLLLATVIGVLNSDSLASPVAGIVVCLGFSHVFEFRPFRNQDDNTLGIILSNSLSLFFLSAIIIKAEENNASSSIGGDLEQTVFGIVLVVILFAGPSVLIVSLIVRMRQWLCGKKKAKFGQSGPVKKRKNKSKAEKAERRTSSLYIDLDAVFDAVKKGSSLEDAMSNPEQGLKSDKKIVSKGKIVSKIKQRLMERAARFADELEEHRPVETKNEHAASSDRPSSSGGPQRRHYLKGYPTNKNFNSGIQGVDNSETVGDESKSMGHWMTMTARESHNTSDAQPDEAAEVADIEELMLLLDKAESLALSAGEASRVQVLMQRQAESMKARTHKAAEGTSVAGEEAGQLLIGDKPTPEPEPKIAPEIEPAPFEVASNGVVWTRLVEHLGARQMRAVDLFKEIDKDRSLVRGFFLVAFASCTKRVAGLVFHFPHFLHWRFLEKKNL